MADALDRLKHALTLSTLDGTVQVRADDVIAMLRQSGSTDALRRVARQIEGARDAAEQKGEGNQREAFDEALDYVLDELRSEPTWSERHAPTVEELSEVRRIDVSVDQPTVRALHLLIERERVSLTEALRRVVALGDSLYRALRVDGERVFLEGSAGRRELALLELAGGGDPLTEIFRVGQRQDLGKAYGRASETIAQLRGENARLRERLRPARGRSLAGPTYETAADYDLSLQLVPRSAQVACVGNSGRIHAVGKVVGYFDHPTFLVELADGTRKSWSSRLVREVEPTGPPRSAGSEDKSSSGPHATLGGDRLYCVHGVAEPGAGTSNRCSWWVKPNGRDPVELWSGHGAVAHNVHGELRWDETERSVVGVSPVRGDAPAPAEPPAAIGDDETVPCCRATGHELREGDGHRFGCEPEERAPAPAVDNDAAGWPVDPVALLQDALDGSTTDQRCDPDWVAELARRIRAVRPVSSPAAPADDIAPATSLRARLVEALGFDHDWEGDDDSLLAYASEQVAQADHCRTRHPAAASYTAAPTTPSEFSEDVRREMAEAFSVARSQGESVRDALATVVEVFGAAPAAACTEGHPPPDERAAGVHVWTATVDDKPVLRYRTPTGGGYCTEGWDCLADHPSVRAAIGGPADGVGGSRPDGPAVSVDERARAAIRRALDGSNVGDDYEVGGLIDDVMDCLSGDGLAVCPSAATDGAAAGAVQAPDVVTAARWVVTLWNDWPQRRRESVRALSTHLHDALVALTKAVREAPSEDRAQGTTPAAAAAAAIPGISAWQGRLLDARAAVSAAIEESISEFVSQRVDEHGGGFEANPSEAARIAVDALVMSGWRPAEAPADGGAAPGPRIRANDLGDFAVQSVAGRWTTFGHDGWPDGTYDDADVQTWEGWHDVAGQPVRDSQDGGA